MACTPARYRVHIHVPSRVRVRAARKWTNYSQLRNGRATSAFFFFFFFNQPLVPRIPTELHNNIQAMGVETLKRPI